MEIFKDLVWDNLIEAGLAKLYLALPFLNIWPINSFINYIVKTYSDALYELMDETVDVGEIILRNENVKEVYGTEAVKLKIIAKNKGIDSKEFKDARIKSREKLRAAIRIKSA